MCLVCVTLFFALISLNHLQFNDDTIPLPLFLKRRNIENLRAYHSQYTEWFLFLLIRVFIWIHTFFRINRVFWVFFSSIGSISIVKVLVSYKLLHRKRNLNCFKIILNRKKMYQNVRISLTNYEVEVTLVRGYLRCIRQIVVSYQCSWDPYSSETERDKRAHTVEITTTTTNKYNNKHIHRDLKRSCAFTMTTTTATHPATFLVDPPHAQRGHSTLSISYI